ncbi:hypothetical protein M23134_05856 [Microscilla marina ATCC 23134]|uniref:Uncharacterized protein n=1 Tax=Microscilla marina ATCC 23134 TaxID=313606 RepID=A1ZXK6_MICM2|nr:hypothetical protein M23134_05856 [Microscilla marina ATCC 23134]
MKYSFFFKIIVYTILAAVYRLCWANMALRVANYWLFLPVFSDVKNK